jgi:hypothetical protein
MRLSDQMRLSDRQGRKAAVAVANDLCPEATLNGVTAALQKVGGDGLAEANGTGD